MRQGLRVVHQARGSNCTTAATCVHVCPAGAIGFGASGPGGLAEEDTATVRPPYFDRGREKVVVSVAARPALAAS